MKPGYKKDIFIRFSSGLDSLKNEAEHKKNPFYPHNLWNSLEKLGAVYKGEANEICRGSYVFFIPEENVYLTCLVWMECEYTGQIVYLEGDTEEKVEYAEAKLKRVLFNEAPKATGLMLTEFCSKSS